ncbi:MAG: hypothetical protein ACKV2U_23595 [Bryobacteraceae bacterium]
MVFEVVFFFVSLSVLGLWLFAREALGDWRRRNRARRVRALLQTLPGKDLTRAEAILGPAVEIVAGSGGRRLFVWKAPAVFPEASPLLIITLTVDAAGIVTHAAWEER